MITGKNPFPKLIKNYINKKYTQLNSELYNTFITKISNNLRQFLEKIFKINPLERPTASDLLKDIFISSPQNLDEFRLLIENISKGISSISN